MSEPILPYGHVDQRDLFSIASKSPSFRSAVVCWLISLGVGIAIFGLWILTRAQALQFAGFFWLGGGTLLAAVSVLCLLVFVTGQWSQAQRPLKQVLLPAALLLAMLGSNFVAAAGVIRAVRWVEMNWPRH